MTNLFKTWARWFFKKQIRAYMQSWTMTPEMLVLRKYPDYEKEVKNEMAYRIARAMIANGDVDFEQYTDKSTSNIIINARVHVI